MSQCDQFRNKESNDLYRSPRKDEKSLKRNLRQYPVEISKILLKVLLEQEGLKRIEAAKNKRELLEHMIKDLDHFSLLEEDFKTLETKIESKIKCLLQSIK